MSYTQKYLKYKKKYLDLKYYMAWGGKIISKSDEAILIKSPDFYSSQVINDIKIKLNKEPDKNHKKLHIVFVVDNISLFNNDFLEKEKNPNEFPEFLNLNARDHKTYNRIYIIENAKLVENHVSADGKTGFILVNIINKDTIHINTMR